MQFFAVRDEVQSVHVEACVYILCLTFDLGHVRFHNLSLKLDLGSLAGQSSETSLLSGKSVLLSLSSDKSVLASFSSGEVSEHLSVSLSIGQEVSFHFLSGVPFSLLFSSHFVKFILLSCQVTVFLSSDLVDLPVHLFLL